MVIKSSQQVVRATNVILVELFRENYVCKILVHEKSHLKIVALVFVGVTGFEPVTLCL